VLGCAGRNQQRGLRFHDLRHSYGTWLADDGIIPNKLAKVMGHEDIATKCSCTFGGPRTTTRSVTCSAVDADVSECCLSAA
jgi:hypothetical protein